MKICLISKYPPIQGGESAKAYWLAKALGKRGVEVHVITNAWEVENDYRTKLQVADLPFYQPQNVSVHNTDPLLEPHYIPFSSPYTEKLASYAIEIIRRYKIDIIDSWYILPYVVSGFLAKVITGKPQIMRHAGSDMTRLISSPYLNTLFISLFQMIDVIVTHKSRMDFFISANVPSNKLHVLSNFSIDPEAFNPDVLPLELTEYTTCSDDIPVIAYIGKTGISKGIYELIEAASRIKDKFLLLLVTKGIGLSKFKQHVEAHGLNDKCLFMDFVPPWRVPSIIQRSRCVVVPERDFSVKTHSPILPREVMALGKCMMISDEIYKKKLNPFWEAGKNVIVVNPYDITEFQVALTNVIRKPEWTKEIGREALAASQKLEKFDLYVDGIISLYEMVLNKCC